MAISVSGVIGWDFTSASTPLASKVGQAETFSLLSGATVDTTNGIVCNAGYETAELTCTNGSALVGWSYPYSVVQVITTDRTGAGSQTHSFNRMNSAGSTNIIGAYLNVTNGVTAITNGSYTKANASTIADLTETIVIFEIRANGLSVWHGSTLQVAETGQSITMPTLATTDVFVFGSRDGNNPKVSAKGFALVPGAMTSTDRTDIAADWRTALLGAAATTSRAVFPFFLG